MATISIKTPDGKTIELNAPEGATQEQIRQAAQTAVAHYKQTTTPPVSNMEKVKALFSQAQSIQPTNLIQQAAPSNIGRMMGVASVNAPNVGGLIANSLPGIGNPSRIPQAVQGIVSNPGQVVQAVKQSVVPEASLSPREQLGGMIGNMAGAAIEGTTIPPLIEEAAGAGQLGKPGRFLMGPSREAAGAAQGAAEKAAGINQRIAPEIKTGLNLLGLKRGNNPAEYVTALAKKIDQLEKIGVDMPVDELSQHHDVLSSIIKNEPTFFAKKFANAKDALTPQGKALASDLNNTITEKLNSMVKGRANATANYAAAMARQKLYKYGGGAAAGVALGKNALINAFQRLTQ